ncbi:MAG TPA: histidine kinase [Usitatibacter sp.]|jgi:sensor histidine kinase YesM|nr:histidine kinase [Usitatibacter sp.]
MEPAAFSDVTHFHPLELIPFFRRFPRSRGRNLMYTFIWSALLCALFLLPTAAFQGRLPTPRQAWLYLVVSLFIGYAIHALFEGTALLGLDRWARRHGVMGKTLYFALIPMLGAITGFQAADWVLGIGFDNWMVSPSWILSIAGTSLSISIVISTVFYVREREARGEAALAAERARIERMEREAVAANLRALQAQIEPHFLFNTLANVASLVDREPREAKRMLERFIRFLRASLAATRMERTTLGAERELIAAYLDVLQVRMGERLRYAIDVGPELESFPIAPMLLQPVVENAIRHGLEPKMEGGSVRVAARRECGEVVVEIADTGVGFAPKTGGGVGLSNLRERLRGLYGPRAALAITENRPAGTVVAFRIPA